MTMPPPLLMPPLLYIVYRVALLVVPLILNHCLEMTAAEI